MDKIIRRISLKINKNIIIKKMAFLFIPFLEIRDTERETIV